MSADVRMLSGLTDRERGALRSFAGRHTPGATAITKATWVALQRKQLATPGSDGWEPTPDGRQLLAWMGLRGVGA